jgi:hypothetical protein
MFDIKIKVTIFGTYFTFTDLEKVVSSQRLISSPVSDTNNTARQSTFPISDKEINILSSGVCGLMVTVEDLLYER